MPLIYGTGLNATARRDALARFVHRYTGDHKPAWARDTRLRSDGTEYPLQFASDADWLANTEFYVTKAGALHARRACHSRPTWPNNPELRNTHKTGN